MIIARLSLFFQRIFRVFFESMCVVVFRKKGGYIYLKKGTFIESKPGYSYVPDYYVNARHKQVDIRTLPKFGGLAAQVVGEGRTLLCYDRLYTIYQSLQSVKRNIVDGQAVNFAEIGVFKGGTSRFIALCAAAMKLNSRLHSFDTFEGHTDVDIVPGVDREDVHTSGL